jgi:hypothetical protein
MSFFIIACTSEPVKVDLPDNHPANPQYQGTAFIPPPNPFQNNIPIVKHEAESSSSMTHEKHQPADQHQMSPNMEHYSKPSQASEEQNPEHQHKEHDQ